MKLIAIVLGLAFAAVAVAYFLVPAGSLPSFFPGFEAGSAHIHTKHAFVSGVLAVLSFGVAWLGARSSR
jgi:hypothetical protein